MKDFTEWMNENKKGSHAKRLTLADGVSLSVQASEYNYSYPRVTLTDYGDYSEVEIGFPSEAIPEIMSYAEDAERPTKTVYGYVPDNVIRELIEARGGLMMDDKEPNQ